MDFPDDQIAELKALCPGVACGEEGGSTYFVLPSLLLPDGCEPSQIDALLCPTPRDGYSSRLFFAAKLRTRKPLNWNAVRVRILERNWDAYSWRIKRDDLRLAQMISCHLEALR